MNFKPELVEKILAGQKTQTRRVASENPRSPWFIEQCGLTPGRVYAVCPGRGKPGVARVRVDSVYKQKAGWITDRQAVAEGFAQRREFIDYWTRLHGHFDPETIVWVVTFELVAA